MYFEWRGGSSGPGGSRIAITPGLVEHLAAGFGRTWQRPPTDAELKGLVDEYAKEEIATREAATPPSDAELQAWWDAHPDSFRAEPQLAFRQVYVSRERRGPRADADARGLLARL